MSHWPPTRAFPQLSLVIALLAALLVPASTTANLQFAQAGWIEGVVTKAPNGARLEGVVVCAFDVAEDEEFTECAETKSNGSYEILGLDEGPYRVQFKPSQSGLAPQYFRNAATPGTATNVQVEEGQASTGINAQLGPTVEFAAGYSVTANAIEVRVRSGAPTPVAATAAMPGPSPRFLRDAKTVSPGKPATFRLPIPDDLDAQLHRLDAGDSLTLKLHARATKVKGKVSADRLRVRLPSRA